MNTITKKYPEGTTKEQWDEYEKRSELHNEYITHYRHFLKRICEHLEFNCPNNKWTTEQIHDVMTSEIKKSHSMDAPNRPGYYRANND